MRASPCLFHYHLHSIEHHGTLHIKKHKRINKEMRRFIKKKILFHMYSKFVTPFTQREREREREREITCCNPEWGQEEQELRLCKVGEAVLVFRV